jgi:hypothetical protein
MDCYFHFITSISLKESIPGTVLKYCINQGSRPLLPVQMITFGHEAFFLISSAFFVPLTSCLSAGNEVSELLREIFAKIEGFERNSMSLQFEAVERKLVAVERSISVLRNETDCIREAVDDHISIKDIERKRIDPVEELHPG